MKEVCIHGRGGQGSLALSQLMAIAAWEDGKYGQAFPFLGGGGERKGKPIMAFCRLSDKPIRLRCRVNAADYVIVQDASILDEMDITEGIKEGGEVFVNTNRNSSDLNLRGQFRIQTFPADEFVRRFLKEGISNVAILGAFAALTRELSLDAILKAVKSKFPVVLDKKYAPLVRACYEHVVRI